ncbi:MAG: hypothetical protein IJU79_01545 [Desulfovibrionaceae bacterium]|nr:hypothetical protein [Desulfovibrionaceae bacterium]
MAELSKAQKRALHVLGFLFLRMGLFARARRLFAALVAIDPGDLNARISLAYSAIKLNDGETALHTLTGIAPGDPIPGGDSTLHLLLARAYNLVGESTQAQEAVQAFWQERTRQFQSKS